MFLFKTLTVILCLGSTAVVDQCNTGSEKAECLLQTAKDLMDDVNGDASLLETEDDDPESLLETQDELRMTAITDKKNNSGNEEDDEEEGNEEANPKWMRRKRLQTQPQGQQTQPRGKRVTALP